MPYREAANRNETVALWLLTLAAAVIAVLTIKRELSSDEASATRFDGARFEANLVDVEAAIEIAGSDGGVTIVEFVDIECSACAFYHEKVVLPLLAELEQLDARVSFRVVLLPLPVHPNADVAAHAAVCAAAQGRFGDFLRLSFASQAQFPDQPWLRIASDAGVPDDAAFRTCLEENVRPMLVTEGIRTAELAGIRATPTVVVNGWVLPRPATKEELSKVVRSLLDGDDPFR
jgi:protein-disulfide isomerase